MLELWISIISITDWWIALIEEWISIKGLSFLPFHGTVGVRTFLRFGCLNVLGPISPNDFHSMMTSSNGSIFLVTGPLCGEFTCHRWIPLTKASDMEPWRHGASDMDLRRHRAHYDLTVMHISSVIKISFCRISFSGHQNKFCACLDSIYGSRVMCKNCSDIRRHRLNSNQSKTNCPKNLNSDGLIVREMGPWPECIFRSLLQFLVMWCYNLSLP